MVIIVTNNRNIFSIFLLGGWHAWEGGTSRTTKFESTHVRENLGTPFTRMWLDQRSDFNRDHEVVILNDQQSSSN